jgi:hypothetical protein
MRGTWPFLAPSPLKVQHPASAVAAAARAQQKARVTLAWVMSVALAKAARFRRAYFFGYACRPCLAPCLLTLV